MSTLSEQRRALFGSEAHVRLAHPCGFDQGLTLDDAVTMIRRALNCVDPRLVDHGLRVAAILDAMLQIDASLSAAERRAVYFLAMLHDIGAYRTEEIDRRWSLLTSRVKDASTMATTPPKPAGPAPTIPSREEVIARAGAHPAPQGAASASASPR